ncbi:MAG: DegT/DnrJ/EryC1/StrS family aminotransferase, partial [Planctomycetota bacterium]
MKNNATPAALTAPPATPTNTTPTNTTPTNTTPAAAATPVPMLDINRQNAPLREEVLQAVAGVCDSGAFLFGPPVKELEARVADYCGTEHAVGCASGSDALLLAMMALGIGCGDEVI